MKKPLIGKKDFEAFIGQGEQAQGRSWRLTKVEGILCMWERKKKKRMNCEEGFSSYVWRGVHSECVQELSMEGSCV
jgi:hypothetical protein